MKDETMLIVLQMQGDQQFKRDKEASYQLYLEAAALADKIGKEEAAKCIREKIKVLFPHID